MSIWGTDAQWSILTATVDVNYSCDCDATAQNNSRLLTSSQFAYTAYNKPVVYL